MKEFILTFSKPFEVRRLVFSEKPSDRQLESCPKPEVFKAVEEAHRDTIIHPGDIDRISRFVGLLKKLMFKYDCRRSFDYEPVPAWYLCDKDKKDSQYPCGYEEIEKWFALLSQSDSQEARKLFGSALFRKTLDGMYAEMYMERSEKVEKQLKRSK